MRLQGEFSQQVLRRRLGVMRACQPQRAVAERRASDTLLTWTVALCGSTQVAQQCR